MVKSQYQAPSLVEIGGFGEMTTGFIGIASDGNLAVFKRNDFMR
ncbi:hypothetical protein [Streptomyces sp. UNOC14_S4]|nr:hypothetical protein [Streptomyces sp. UNOC14_S4]